MDSESYAMARWLLEHPEKSALGAVIVAGVWRILREIWKDVRGKKDETLIETLMRENYELRAELRHGKRDHDHDHEELP